MPFEIFEKVQFKLVFGFWGSALPSRGVPPRFFSSATWCAMMNFDILFFQRCILSIRSEIELMWQLPDIDRFPIPAVFLHLEP